MTWYVYYHNINKRCIQPYNVFDHHGFLNDVRKALESCKTKTEFAEQLKRALMYWFWCKAEWEIIVAPWCGGSDREAIKVDVYSQVMLNWELFVDYTWGWEAPSEKEE